MNWHRLFGLLLSDFFASSPYSVELEKDLSLKQQFLDVVIIRKGKGRFSRRLPDGLDDLADHNLITFKSHQDILDDWTFKELTGHYVNYRKQLSAAGQPLLPESAFRLYAVCSRFPHNLSQTVPWLTVREGVYECRRGTDVMRVIVAGQLPQHEHNAMLHLFSAAAPSWQYGAEHYRQLSPDTSTLIFQLLEGYQREGIAMPYTMEDFRREFMKEHLKDFFKDLTPEQMLAALTPEQRKRLRQQLLTEERAQPKKGRRK